MLEALMVAAALLGAPGHARLVPAPGPIVAGRPATGTLVFNGTAPRVRFTSALSPTAVTATGRRVRRTRYSVRFTLPLGGRWSYRITAGRKTVGAGSIDARVDSRLPGATASPICAGAGSFWPTETLAFDFGTPWLACKENGLLLRLAPRKVFRLGGSTLIGVTTGFGSVWALDNARAGRLLRIDPVSNAVTARIDLGTSGAYNVWAGSGSMWVAGDQSAEIVRVDPQTNVVVARIEVGDGPADLAFDGTSVYVIDHRDGTLFRIDTRTNESRLIAKIPGDAPERMVLLDDRLWITGRGTDLLEVDPASGNVLRTVEIGAGGIDVVAASGALWVPSRSAESDARGFPTMETLRRVDPRTGSIASTLSASGPLDVHGLVADEGGVWLADNTRGVLYRVAR